MTNKERGRWATWFADVAEDIAQAIVLFIPNGLNAMYNMLKRLPVVGTTFSHKGFETFFKFCTGISILQELGQDVAYFLFRPLGFVIGYLIGLFNQNRTAVVYQGQVGRLINKFSGQTVAGILLGMLASLLFAKQSSTIWMMAGLGGVLGIFAKTIFLFALHSFNEANAVTIRKNVQRAKQISARLKVAVREKAKSRILRQAQDIIQQMNGAQSQQNLAEFFQNEYDKIALSTYKKIERHFDYLTDRACHGDLNALKKLHQLLPRPKTPEQTSGKDQLDAMLERMFNARAIARLKDEVDSAYDRWQYRFLRA
ncbi:hypothetical protein [Candidatus Berkiella aquae]|uniref:Uncharacterized protein n=1 Tax=Candidatus Berkiella aquae TaxID=295108 RepID=A0A0Q9YKS7_9GAMM|nr:hypothetical protein [Candidatus Berkiella aquae]MCS5710869.1 hypothetical protein [Candidatus Berkiella aquae]